MGNRSRDISKGIIITREKRIEFSVKKKMEDLISLNSTYGFIIINLITKDLTNKFLEKAFCIKRNDSYFQFIELKLFTRCPNIEKGEVLHEETIHSRSFIFEEINSEKTFQFLIRYE